MLLAKPISTIALSLGFWIFCLQGSGLAVDTGGPVRVRGVAALSRVMKAASLPLREMGIDVKVGEDCNNAQALEALGNNQIDIALVGRHLTSEDRAAYPDKTLQEIRIGTQTVALMVPKSVWQSGVQALKKEQMAKLYEGRIGTWQELGGENRSTKFFEPAHGYGVWEIFVAWLYGDTRKAPAVKWEVVNSGAEAQNAVQFFSGATTVASVRWADGKEVFPVAIIDDSGNTVEPTPANVAAGTYPMTRPAYAVVGLKPSANRRKVLEFLLSEQGQAIVAANELLPIGPAAAPTPK